MGTPMFAVPILKSLYQNGYNISVVYTQPPQKSNRGQKITKSPIQGISETLNIDYRNPQTLKDNQEEQMTDFNKILDKAKELETKMKQSQENIEKIRVEGISGSNSVKVILDGKGEMQKIEISDEIIGEEKSIIEDLIVAAHNNAKSKLKTKTDEEISKAAGGFGIPGFKWPL